MKTILLGEKGSNEFESNMKKIEAEFSIGIKLARSCKFFVYIFEFFIDEWNYVVVETK
jgi:hypothetical protein